MSESGAAVGRLSRDRAFLLLRYTLIAATAYLILVEQDFRLPPVFVVVAIAVALLSNVLIALLPRRILDSTSFNAAVVVGDTLWISAALISSGRFSAEFFYLYFFVLLMAAMGENLQLIVGGALVVCGAYLYVLMAGGELSLWRSPTVIRIPFLFTAAAFYGYLVDRTRGEQRVAAAAETAMKAKSAMLAVVSHELRTPTSAILGWSELLLDSSLDSDQRESAEGVHRAAEMLLSLVNGLLDFSKMEARKVELELTTFDLRTLVEDSLELVAQAAAQKGLALNCRIAPAVPKTVRGDAGRVRRVLVNLVSNAVKFTARGEVAVRVAVAGPSGKTVTLRIEVADTGVGIRSEQRERIFEPFAQGDGSTGRAYGGTGLGLAISRQLVGLMGGEIGVTSEPGRGSTFWFTVRLQRDTAEAALPALSGGSSARISRRAAGS
jgi:signal transduction histidine kinase